MTVIRSSRDVVVAPAWCPSCDWPLERWISTVGSIKGSLSWHNKDGHQVDWCPRCDHELPRSELDRKEAA